jgi:hypothetical protein
MNRHDIQLLYDYNRWANARILGAAGKLAEEQYLALGTFPHGGVRGTLIHVLFAEWMWRMRWQGTALHAEFDYTSTEGAGIGACCGKRWHTWSITGRSIVPRPRRCSPRWATLPATSI